MNATRKPTPPVYSFFYQGVEYRFSSFGEALRLAFERWFREEAVALLMKLRPTMEPDTFTEAALQLLREFAAGERYAIASPGTLEAMTTQPGMVALLGILLGVDRLTSFELLMGAGDDVKAGLARVADSFRAAAR